MRLSFYSRVAVLGCVAAGNLLAQAAPPLIMQPPNPELAKPAQQAPPQQQPQAQQPQTQVAAPHLADSRGFLLGGVSLSEMIDILAKMMKINYILDPRVKGSVTIYTYGEVKPVDLMPLMETILRVNGAAMVKIGRSLPHRAGKRRGAVAHRPDGERRLQDAARRRAHGAQPDFSEVRDGRGNGQAADPVLRRRREPLDLRPGQPADHPGQQPQHEADHGADHHVRFRHFRRPAGAACSTSATAGPRTW